MKSPPLMALGSRWLRAGSTKLSLTLRPNHYGFGLNMYATKQDQGDQENKEDEKEREDQEVQNIGKTLVGKKTMKR